LNKVLSFSGGTGIIWISSDVSVFWGSSPSVRGAVPVIRGPGPRSWLLDWFGLGQVTPYCILEKPTYVWEGLLRLHSLAV